KLVSAQSRYTASAIGIVLSDSECVCVNAQPVDRLGEDEVDDGVAPLAVHLAQARNGSTQRVRERVEAIQRDACVLARGEESARAQIGEPRRGGTLAGPNLLTDRARAPFAIGVLPKEQQDLELFDRRDVLGD